MTLSVRRAGVLLVASLAASGAPAGQPVFVDQGAGGEDDGSSWTNALTDLQGALVLAATDPNRNEIWVASGTYTPDGGTGDRGATFSLLSNVALLGGFAGDENDSAQRDPNANPTVLSGDLLDNDDGAAASLSDNSLHVVTALGVDNSAVLDGFVIAGGFADGAPPDDCGGGLYIDGADPVVRRCRFERNNAALRGGGLLLKTGNPAFTECAFLNNSAFQGGALAAVDGGSLALVRCRFVRNGVDAAFRVIDGGAVMVMETAGFDVTILDCDFIENDADCSGGGLYINGDINALVARCRFLRNRIGPRGGRGGGIRSAANITVTNSLFVANIADSNPGQIATGGGLQNAGMATVVNSAFVANEARGTGEELAGGAGVDSDGSLHMVNCTVVGNTARHYGGVLIRLGGVGVLENCISWDNRNELASTLEASQVFADTATGGSVSVDYSCVEGWSGALGGVGNHGLDPLFVDPVGDDGMPRTGDEDVRLRPNSPCVDAGDNTAVPPDAADLDDDDDTTEPTPLDLNGHPRFADLAGAPNVGNPDGVHSPVDMGAFEAQPCADLDGDLDTDLDDLTLLLQNFEGADVPSPGGDIDGDGDTDLDDLTLLLRNFGVACL